jgi:glucose-1-phosphate thymidylyltransferase
LFEDPLSSAVEEFCQRQDGAHVFLKKVIDPRRYGVPELLNGRITGIVEKPQQPANDYAVTGIYLYDSKVFEIIRTLKPSGRGELEITDVNNAYAAMGQLTYSHLNGWWTDAGTHRSLLEAGLKLMERDDG